MILLPDSNVQTILEELELDREVSVGSGLKEPA